MLHVTRQFLASIGKLLLRLAYRRTFGIEDHDQRTQQLQYLYRVRQRIHPLGGCQLDRADFNGGLKAYVNLCELVGGDIYYGVPFEPIEIALAKSLVEPGDVFFDVGANVGIYSLVVSRKVGNRGSGHAFEPFSFAYELLLRNLRLNHITNVTSNCLAVGEKSGQVDLFVNRESALTSLGRTKRGQVVGIERANSISLDEYAETHQILEVDFLKVDVEGYEGHVLRGGKRLIERSKNLAILCELAEKNFRSLDLSVNEVMDWMRWGGYEVWEVDRSSQFPVKLETNRNTYANQNFIFVRPGSAKQHVLQEKTVGAR